MLNTLDEASCIQASVSVWRNSHPINPKLVSSRCAFLQQGHPNNASRVGGDLQAVRRGCGLSFGSGSKQVLSHTETPAASGQYVLS